MKIFVGVCLINGSLMFGEFIWLSIRVVLGR